MRFLREFLFLGFLALPASLISAQSPAAEADAKPDTTWFTDAGFGIFLHWGAYSTAAGRWQGKERDRDLWGEWLLNRAGIGRTAYEDLARRFYPTDFNPTEWADVFKASGARYIVLTAKHHEGFAMYHSKASPFNAHDWPTNYHGDPVRELGDAVRKENLKFCVYYSQKIDWHNCGQGADFATYFNKICVPQVTELLQNYGPLGIMWFDIGVDKPYASRLRALVRQYSPQTLISPRIGANEGDYEGGGDNEVPTKVKASPWESCMTMNYHWATYPQDIYQRSAMEVIRMLADIRSKGGNLLLDIGPDAKGRLAARDVIVLRLVGKWLDTFGPSIYQVKASPLARVPWGCVTSGADSTLYLHVYDIPSRGEVVLPGVIGNMESAWLLGDPQKRPLTVKKEGDRDFHIDLGVDTAPASALCSEDTVVAVKLADGATFDPAYLLQDDVDNVFTPSLADLGGGASTWHERATLNDLDPAVEKCRYDDLGFLPKPDSTLQWKYRANGNTDYHLLVSYANPFPQTVKLTLKCDDQVFTADLPPTPPDFLHRLATIRVGTFPLRAAGAHVMVASVNTGNAAPVTVINGNGKKEPARVAINQLTLMPTRTTLLDPNAK